MRDIQNRTLFIRYAIFCVVGASGVGVDMAVLYLLVQLGQTAIWVSVSKIAAAETAIVSNFILNDLWTFRQCVGISLKGPTRIRRFLRFNLICASGILLSVAILNALVFWVGLNLYFANSVAIVVVSVWNFTLSRRFAWKA